MVEIESDSLPAGQPTSIATPVRPSTPSSSSAEQTAPNNGIPTPLDTALPDDEGDGDDELDASERKMKKRTNFRSDLRKKTNKFTASPLFNTTMFKSSKSGAGSTGATKPTGS